MGAKITQTKKVIIKYFFLVFFCFLGLSDMPVGTGTLYVVDCETEEAEAEEANCPPSGAKNRDSMLMLMLRMETRLRDFCEWKNPGST